MESSGYSAVCPWGPSVPVCQLLELRCTLEPGPGRDRAPGQDSPGMWALNLCLPHKVDPHAVSSVRDNRETEAQSQSCSPSSQHPERQEKPSTT